MKAEEVYSKLKKMIAQSAAGITGRTSTTNPDGSVTVTISFTSGSPLSFTISPVKGEDGVGFKDAKIKEVINTNNETEYHLILVNDKDKDIDAGILPTNDDMFQDYEPNKKFKEGTLIVYNDKIYKVNNDFMSSDINSDIVNGNIRLYVGGNSYNDPSIKIQINDLQNNKVDKVSGKSLLDDSEIARLASLKNYDDTHVKTQISNINKAVGDINTLTVVGVKDLVSAVNKLDLSFMQSLVYNVKGGKKLLTITYKNGNTTDVDLSAIITGTKIGELENVDDTGITDKQLLGYDSSTGKYIPMTINNSNVLQEAKKYTDQQINTINHVEGKVVDSKPTIVTNSDGTYSVTYIQNGTSTTTTDNMWFFYNTGTNTYAQTIFIDGVEITLSMNGSINLTNYVNKTTDLASGFTGNEIDKTKVTTIKELDDLFALINIALGKKINTSDVIDDLQHTDIDKPLSANQGKVLKDKIDNISSTLSGSILIKKQFNNVTGGVENKFDSPVSLKGGYVSAVYSVKSGSTNLSGVLKEFNSSTKQDFIKIEDEVFIDGNGAKIKDEHKIIPIENNSLFIYNINDINAENIVLESD